MYVCRPAFTKDYPINCTFPQNAVELFAMYPSGKYPLTPEQLEKAARVRWHPTVVLYNNCPVGYANFYGLEEKVKCSLGNVIVDPLHRGKGASSELIQEMIRLAKEELKVQRLELICHNTNTPGLLFYTKLGFKPFAIRKMKNHMGETIAGILMDKELY